MAYTVGDVVKCPIQFRNPDTKALLNPTAWFVEVKPPNADKRVLEFGVDAELDQVADPGEFIYRQPTDASSDDDAGRWECFLFSTGTGQAARAFHFVVGPRPIPA